MDNEVKNNNYWLCESAGVVKPFVVKILSECTTGDDDDAGRMWLTEPIDRTIFGGRLHAAYRVDLIESLTELEVLAWESQ